MLVLLVLLTVPVAMIVSSLYPRFRDVAIIWTVFSTALFYASPIFYTMNSTQVVHHTTLRRILEVNPLTPILELARKWMLHEPHAPDPLVGVLGVAGPLAIFVALWVLAIWIFNREAPRIAEQL